MLRLFGLSGMSALAKAPAPSNSGADPMIAGPLPSGPPVANISQLQMSEALQRYRYRTQHLFELQGIDPHQMRLPTAERVIRNVAESCVFKSVFSCVAGMQILVNINIIFIFKKIIQKVQFSFYICNSDEL